MSKKKQETTAEKIERLKKAFQVMKSKTKIDHSEWIEADNLDEIRVFASTDWLNNIEGELQVENEHGSVYALSELSDSELDVLIFSLEN